MTKGAALKNTFILTLVLALLILPLSPGLASDLYQQRESINTQVNAADMGNPPPLDFTKVPSDAMESELLRVKFKPETTRTLEQIKVKHSVDGIVITGISELDNLNTQYGATRFQSLLEPLYEVSEASHQYRRRHRAFGLHLWYEIRIERGRSVKEAATSYLGLDSVEIVEPVYKKKHIGSIDPAESRLSGATVPRELLQSSWQPNDPRFSEQWSLRNSGQHGGTAGVDLDLVKAWAIEKGSSEVIVAICDDGLQFDHPDLKANIWPGIGPEGTDTPKEDHGTHVAGIVAAVSNNKLGMAGIAGGSGSGDGVRLMAVEIVQSAHGLSDLALYTFQADNGVAISQNSWAFDTEGNFPRDTKDGIDYFNTYGGGDVLDGGLIIFAAGNDESSGNWYPARYEGVMAVAATNNRDQKAWYSNYGSWVEISAPGGETREAREAGILSTVNNNSYDFYQGSSMAAPHVAGVAALMVSLAPGRYSASEIRTILKETADDHYALNPDYVGKLGSGRLNAYKALKAIANPTFPDVPPHHVHFAGIEAIAAEGITTGYDDGTFRPSQAVTRAEMATFLFRTLKLTDPVRRGTFPDVAAGSTHEVSIEAIAAVGITTGYADGTFRPSQAVTRAEMATFLARALKLADPGRRGTFPDVTAGSTHEVSIEAIAAVGITTGYADGTFRPSQAVTRAEMATFLARALAILAD